VVFTLIIYRWIAAHEFILRRDFPSKISKEKQSTCCLCKTFLVIDPTRGRVHPRVKTVDVLEAGKASAFSFMQGGKNLAYCAQKITCLALVKAPVLVKGVEPAF
jgi:hypothetical protein